MKLRLDDELVLVLGERAFPWAEVKVEDNYLISDPDQFATLLDAHAAPDREPDYRVRHAWIPFENGLRVSLSWGSFSGSPNGGTDMLGEMLGFPVRDWTEEPEVVEAAVQWGDPDDPENRGFVGLILDGDDDGVRRDVLPWQTIPEVLDLIDAASSWPSSTRTHPWSLTLRVLRPPSP